MITKGKTFLLYFHILSILLLGKYSNDWWLLGCVEIRNTQDSFLQKCTIVNFVNWSAINHSNQNGFIRSSLVVSIIRIANQLPLHRLKISTHRWLKPGYIGTGLLICSRKDRTAVTAAFLALCHSSLYCSAAKCSTPIPLTLVYYVALSTPTTACTHSHT